MKIPVLLATHELPTARAGDALVRLALPKHAHAPDGNCPACASAGDVRVALYELVVAARRNGKALPARVVVDARRLPDVTPTRDRLTGRAPAAALRDHVVARTFEFVP